MQSEMHRRIVSRADVLVAGFDKRRNDKAEHRGHG
jgi:hypothetical protein